MNRHPYACAMAALLSGAFLVHAQDAERASDMCDYLDRGTVPVVAAIGSGLAPVSSGSTVIRLWLLPSAGPSRLVEIREFSKHVVGSVFVFWDPRVARVEETEEWVLENYNVQTVARDDSTAVARVEAPKDLDWEGTWKSVVGSRGLMLGGGLAASTRDPDVLFVQVFSSESKGTRYFVAPGALTPDSNDAANVMLQTRRVLSACERRAR